MKKTNLVLFVLLTSNVFVKPSRDWCGNPGIEGAIVVGVLGAASAAGCLLYQRGKLAGKIEVITQWIDVLKISKSKIAWDNYTGEKKQEFEEKVNSLFERYDNKDGFNNAKECKRIRTELDKIFDELGIKRDK